MKTNIKTQEQEIVNKPGKSKVDYKAESFVREYKSNGYNGKQAYLVAVNSKVKPSTAATEASTLLKSPNVQALLADLEPQARRALGVMIADNDHKDHFNATKLALAYSHGTPVARTENVNVNVSLEDILL